MRTILTEREKCIRKNEININICAFCGGETPGYSKGGTIDAEKIMDWPARAEYRDVRFVLCEVCFPKFLKNISRQDLRNECQGDDE